MVGNDKSSSDHFNVQGISSFGESGFGAENMSQTTLGFGQNKRGYKFRTRRSNKHFININQERNENFMVYTNQSFVDSYQKKPTKETEWLRNLTDNTPALKKLDEEIKIYFMKNKATEEEVKKKELFRKNIERMIQTFDTALELNWNCQVFATGSSISGLAGRGSDVDCCVWIPNGMKDCVYPERTQSYKALQIIREFINIEVDSKRFPYEIVSITLRDAQIPILKIFTKCKLECDLSVCCVPFLSGVHNSILIKGYTIFDERFAQLAVFVKAWANATGLKSPTPPNAKLNSYAITLLLIHFLQCGVWPPVLPNLRQKCGGGFFATSETVFPKYFDINQMPIPDLGNIDRNEMTLAELFIRFCVYYLYFPYGTHYIDMKLAKVGQSEKGDGFRRDKGLYIEDPIDQHNPGRTLYDRAGAISIFQYTVNLFVRAYRFPDSYSFPSAKLILKKLQLKDGAAPVQCIVDRGLKASKQKTKNLRHRGRGPVN